ncbi:hypothetical protein GW17_00007226 [Ensete ventricosum]|nr:hypothetical protein GW17_00007226 [Ensete ventricosum]
MSNEASYRDDMVSDMTNADLAAKSSHPRTAGPSTARTADLTQVRSAPPNYKHTPRCKDSKHGGWVRRYADLPSRALNHHSSRQALTPYREDREAGELAHTGLNHQMIAQRTWRRDASTRQAPETSLSFLALEGGPMSPERPLTDSGTERQTEPDHPRLAEEVPAAMRTPNRFWRMMTDPGFTSPASNPAPFMITAEAFLGLTSQVQALAGMVQTIIPYLPQLVHSAAHQPAPLQTESPTAPSRGIPPVAEATSPRVTEVPPPRVPVSPTPTPTRSQSRSYNPAPTEPDLDTLSTNSTDSLREQVRRVHQRLDEVQKEVLRSKDETGESSKGGSPFTPEIQSKPLPTTFRLPALEPYDGSGDPMEHIATFRSQMALYDISEALMCRAFPTTLRGSARTWYARLKPASIPSFDVLAREFELSFLASARPRPTTASLLGMAQGSDEPLSQFVGRFTSQVQGIPDLHPSLAIQAFLTGLKPSRFFWSLIERPPTTLPEMLQRAHQYVAAETLIAGKRDETKHSRGEPSRAHLAPPPKKREDRSGLLPAKPPPIPLNSTRTEIFFQIREKGLLKAPSPMKSHPERRDKRRYCRFHREYGHDTEECRDLQYQIEDLIRRGHLRRYVREQPSLSDGRPSRDLSPRPQGPVEK